MCRLRTSTSPACISRGSSPPPQTPDGHGPSLHTRQHSAEMTSSVGMITDLVSQDPSTLVTPTGDDYDPDIYCDRSSTRFFRAQYEPPLYWTIAVVGGLGNLMVVWIYLHFRQRLKTMTDVYLLNLAVADLLFLGTLPLWATEAVQGWTFGPGLCTVNSALYKVNLFSGTLLLTCISVERYVVIVETTRAQNSKTQRLRYSRLVCGGVWLLALLLALPEFLFSTTKAHEEIQYCRMVYSSGTGNGTKVLVLALQVSVGFCLPLVIMTFCYTAIVYTLLKRRILGKHKSMRVILAVVLLFVLSQLPYNSSLVLEATLASNIALASCKQMMRLDVAGHVLKSLAYAHSGLNPFLYAFVGERFRKDAVGVLRAYRCWPSKCQHCERGHPPDSVSVSRDTPKTLSL